GLVALLAGGRVRGGHQPAELRQADRARLPGDAGLGQDRARAEAAGGSDRAHARAVCGSATEAGGDRGRLIGWRGRFLPSVEMTGTDCHFARREKSPDTPARRPRDAPCAILRTNTGILWREAMNAIHESPSE